RAREPVRRAPDRLHAKRDDLREGIDVLIPGAVEIAFEQQVLMTELLAVTLVREAVDHRPPCVVDERQLFELLQRLLDMPAGPEDRPQHQRPLALDRSQHGDRGGFAFNVGQVGGRSSEVGSQGRAVWERSGPCPAAHTLTVAWPRYCLRPPPSSGSPSTLPAGHRFPPVRARPDCGGWCLTRADATSSRRLPPDS